MTDKTIDNFLPPEMRALAEQSMQQARKAFDEMMAATQRTVAAFQGQTASAQSGARSFQQKVIGFSERNVAASFEFAQRLLQAKDAEEVMRLHADFVKSQMQALAEQARELAEQGREFAGRHSDSGESGVAGGT